MPHSFFSLTLLLLLRRLRRRRRRRPVARRRRRPPGRRRGVPRHSCGEKKRARRGKGGKSERAPSSITKAEKNWPRGKSRAKISLSPSSLKKQKTSNRNHDARFSFRPLFSVCSPRHGGCSFSHCYCCCSGSRCRSQDLQASCVQAPDRPLFGEHGIDLDKGGRNAHLVARSGPRSDYCLRQRRSRPLLQDRRSRGRFARFAERVGGPRASSDHDRPPVSVMILRRCRYVFFFEELRATSERGFSSLLRPDAFEVFSAIFELQRTQRPRNVGFPAAFFLERERKKKAIQRLSFAPPKTLFSDLVRFSPSLSSPNTKKQL